MTIPTKFFFIFIILFLIVNQSDIHAHYLDDDFLLYVDENITITDKEEYIRIRLKQYDTPDDQITSITLFLTEYPNSQISNDSLCKQICNADQIIPVVRNLELIPRCSPCKPQVDTDFYHTLIRHPFSSAYIRSLSNNFPLIKTPFYTLSDNTKLLYKQYKSDPNLIDITKLRLDLLSIESFDNLSPDDRSDLFIRLIIYTDITDNPDCMNRFLENNSYSAHSIAARVLPNYSSDSINLQKSWIEYINKIRFYDVDFNDAAISENIYMQSSLIYSGIIESIEKQETQNILNSIILENPGNLHWMIGSLEVLYLNKCKDHYGWDNIVLLLRQRSDKLQNQLSKIN